jgi:hypothetical protein
MPKIDKTLLKLIKTLQELNIHKSKSIKKRMKGGNSGMYSCVSMTHLLRDSTAIIWKSKYLIQPISRIVTKVITRQDI